MPTATSTIFSAPDFDCVRRYLSERAAGTTPSSFQVPEILLPGGSSCALVNAGSPYRFYSAVFDWIAERREPVPTTLSSNDVIYQAFLRTFASLNGEIGTALSQIAFLPLLKQRLGVTVFLSLPTGTIGRTNRKGRRGSPFAVSNPFAIDESLGDARLQGVPAATQYKALLQACRMLGMRTGSIVPMATLAMDSPLFKALPALGYWWRGEPGELLRASRGRHDVPHVGGMRGALHLSAEDRSRFVDPPRPEEVDVVVHNGHSYFVADVVREGQRQRVTLANAFPDPVAGDGDDYTWKDVAFIRYTREIYPPAQGVRTRAFDASQPAWRIMPLVIAWRMRDLGEDVFLIDVNESVPEVVLARAAEAARYWRTEHDEVLDQLLSPAPDRGRLNEALQTIDETEPDPSPAPEPRAEFIAEELWQFHLSNSQVSAVVGPLIFCVSAHSHDDAVLVHSLHHHLKQLEATASPKLYFAGTSNHDTIPPAHALALLLQLFYAFLPRSVPMIFSGTEVGSTVLVNREFGFSSPELARLGAGLKDDALALFNDVPLDWRAIDAAGLAAARLSLLQALRALRVRVFVHVPDPDLDFVVLDQFGAPWCLGYRRSVRQAPHDALVVLANWHRHEQAVVPWHGDDARAQCWSARAITEAGRPSCVTAAATLLTPGGDLLMPPRSVAFVATGVFQHLTSGAAVDGEDACRPQSATIA